MSRGARGRAVLRLVLTFAAGCTPEHDYPPIEVDIAANCNRAEVIVSHAALDDSGRPWTRLIDAAADAPGLGGLWALVEYATDTGGTRLGLWHLDGDEVDERLAVDVPVDAADTVRLVPGPAAGDVWLERRTDTSYALARVDADVVGGLPVASVDHSTYPPLPGEVAYRCDEDNNGEGDLCDVRTWPKRLAFIDGEPFLVAVPTSSVDAVTSVYVGRLSSQLTITDLTQLDFVRMCDLSVPIEDFVFCNDQALRISYPRLDVAAAQAHPGAQSWSAFVFREGAIDQFEEFSEVIVVTVGLNQNRVPEGVLRVQSWYDVGDVSVGPAAGFALDEFNAYILHDRPAGPPRLLRLRNADAVFEPLPVDVSEGTELLQLERDIALGEIAGDTWRITKLFPDAPERSEVTTFQTATPITAVRSAGPGSFLVFEEAGGPTLVSLACADP